MSTTPDMTPAEYFAQLAAELAYAAGTSEDNRVAVCDGEAYTAASAAHRAAMRIAFGLSDAELDRARDLLAEYGPHDGAYGTDYPDDVRGHAALARLDVAGQHAADAEQAATDELPWTDEDTEVTVLAYQDKPAGAAHTAYLSERQVGAYTRHLGPGWSVRRTSWTIPGEDELAGLRAQLAG
jgi:hypothetical protein